jgi:hypothetical protein
MTEVVEAEVNLRPTVSRPVCLGAGIPWPDFFYLSDDCRFLDMGHPLWREDGSVIYCTIVSGPCQSSHSWIQVLQNSRPYLLSHLRLPQPGGTGPRIYIPPEQGGPVISPDTGFPFARLSRLSGLRWKYSNPPPHGFHWPCGGYGLSYGRRPVDQFGLVSGSTLRPMTRFYLILSLSQLLCCSSCRASSLTRGRICNLQCTRWLVRSLRTNNHTLPSHLRLCSLFVASYDSQQGLRWRYSNPPLLVVRGDKKGTQCPGV